VTRKFAPMILDVIKNFGDENTVNSALSCVHYLGQHPTVIAEITDDLIELFLDRLNSKFIGKLGFLKLAK
jgi:hypothetical protein